MATIANIAIALTAKTTGMMKGLKSAGRAFARFRRRVGGAFQGLQGLGGIVAGALSVRSIIEANDKFTEMNNRIKSVTGTAREAAAIHDEIFAASQRVAGSTEDFTNTFAGIANVNDDLGFTNKEILRMTETFFKLGKVGGASSEALGRAAFQMTQSFAGGIVRAEEFNSILDASPEVIKAVASQMGISMGQLRQKVVGGTQSAEEFGRALLAASTNADAAFGQLQFTTSDRFTKIQNSWTELIGVISGKQGSNLFSDFLDKVVISLDFVSFAIKNTKEAFEDFKLTLQFMMDNVFPDWLNWIIDIVKRLSDLRFSDFTALNDLSRPGGPSSDRFMGTNNPLKDLEVEEKNSGALLEAVENLKLNVSTRVGFAP